MNITENNTYEMTNVISYRGKVTQQQLSVIMNEINTIIQEKGASKTGPNVSATFAVEMEGGQPVMDVEILVPVDREISLPSGYKFKPLFRLCDAVKIRHEGNPAMLQNSVNELMGYVRNNGLTPITPGYNVTIKEPTGPSDADGLIVDMYVGVTRSVL
ncbi:AraC family transcriptional regulator [Ruminococcus sp. XPD3002]|uniref:AraC family transcriptional regulator n=1 Tax=Ruminococcus sp. XPD3002 TaxID=1452269 RepID=UPI0009193FF8|nr:effector-binding domain-containing protein [Ruminococcus flavefaciens]